jgi:hypoxanthine-DNA glycosylase
MLVEMHPFEPFVPQKAIMLILGTFPPVAQYRDFRFYYPDNARNRFWIIIEYVFDYKFQYWRGDLAVEERKALFDKKHIAITDIIGKCIRSEGNSSDKNLCKIEFRDVCKLLKNQSEIQKIILTSRTDGNSEQMHKKHLSRSRNNSALELFNEHLIENGIVIKNLHKKDNGIIEGEFKLADRIIKIFVPYTPVARWYNIDKTKINNMYKYSFNA